MKFLILVTLCFFMTPKSFANKQQREQTPSQALVNKNPAASQNKKDDLQGATKSSESSVKQPEKQEPEIFESPSHNFHAVQAGALYRSAQLKSAALVHYLKKYQIKSIINLRGRQSKRAWWQAEQRAAKKHGAKLYNIAMNATRPISKKHLTRLLDLYQKATRPILIHCYHGVTRTGQAAALWVLDQQKGTKEQAKQQLFDSSSHQSSFLSTSMRLITQWQGRAWAYQEYDPTA